MDREQLLKNKRALEEQMNNIRKLFKENGKEIISAALKPVFEQFPTLRAIRWCQYTPYFNDGAPCTFSSCHCDPQVQIEEDGDFEECYKKTACYEKPIAEALKPFSDDDMLAIFDDHVEVTVLRDGKIEVDDYDHD